MGQANGAKGYKKSVRFRWDKHGTEELDTGM